MLVIAPRSAISTRSGARGEIGLAVERRENGATHQGSAAKPGEDRSAEPLYRDAAPVDQTAAAAVDRQRRFVAEIDGLGNKPSTMAPRSLALVQNDVPCTRFASAARTVSVRHFARASRPKSGQTRCSSDDRNALSGPQVAHRDRTVEA